MKRIDDKIKEIEKKDNRNRVIFLVIIAVVAAIYVVLTQQTIKNQRETISVQDIKLTETYQSLEVEKERAEKALQDLQNSLDPTEYWESIVDEKTTEAYIQYLTNDWDILKDNIPDALTNIKSSNVRGLDGWIYCGKIDPGSNQFIDQRVSVVWRHNAEGNIELTMPKVNDVVQLKRSRNIYTYKRNNTRLGGRNDEGWRPGTKAFVLDVKKVGAEIRIKIKYY